MKEDAIKQQDGSGYCCLPTGIHGVVRLDIENGTPVCLRASSLQGIKKRPFQGCVVV